MATATLKHLTIEEFLALPNDGMDRELIRGELKERPMSYRSLEHGLTVARVTHQLMRWLDESAEFRGIVGTGDIGFRLPTEPISLVGIDVALFDPKIRSTQTRVSTVIEGIPILAIEVISPSNDSSEIEGKIDLYLEAGVSLIWTIYPARKIVLVYRPDQEPVLFSFSQTLTAEPELPGFSLPVRKLFE
jgi:Uma2 family endonuclease